MTSQMLYTILSLLLISLLMIYFYTTSFLHQVTTTYCKCVNQIEQWSANNFLSFNTSKCKYMIVSWKRNPSLPESQLQLSGSLLERVERYKYLGILITSDLSWSPQVVSVCSKARRVFGLLYRRFYGLAYQDTLKNLYLSLVRLHMQCVKCGILT